MKWQTLAFCVFGTLVGLISSAWYVIVGQLTGKGTVWYSFLIALYYAVPGFISSVIFGVIYNSLAGRLGGLELEIVTHSEVKPPQPAERWEGSLPKINEQKEPLP